MTKEQQALETLKQTTTDHVEYAETDYEALEMGREISYDEVETIESLPLVDLYPEEFDTLDQALQRLEVYDAGVGSLWTLLTYWHDLLVKYHDVDTVIKQMEDTMKINDQEV